MRLSVLLCAIRAKLQPRSGFTKLRSARISRAHPLINRPISKVDSILIKATAKHPALQADGGEGWARGSSRVVENFSELYLRDDVVNALENIGVTQPTVIQMLAIPKIAAGKNVLCASETGSGKTLAYLAPLISRLRDEEEHEGLIPRLKRPRALILLPSRDLAAQVLAVAKSLCHVARFRAVGLIGGIKRRFIRESLKNPVDVAVATPDSLLKFRRQEQVHLSDLSHIVIDEADTLFDPSFEHATNSILKSLQIRSKRLPDDEISPSTTKRQGTQVTIVGATLSTDMLSKIEKLVPNIKKVSTKHLHQILPHVEQRFIKTRQDAKADRLLHLLQSRPSDVFIVFCNTVPSCDWTARFLARNDIPIIKLHAGFSSLDRKDLLKRFMDGESKVLVCTDIASRGIDCSQVSHVVSFDFPYSLPDYLHRVGRTGRVGSVAGKCRATTFMSHRRDVVLAWKVKDAANKREALMNRRVMSKLDKLEQTTISRSART